MTERAAPRLVIREVETAILDLPIRRPHFFAHLTITRQSFVLVRVRTEDGLVGIGEGVTAGGPWWGGESVETMKAILDAHLGPLAVGEDASRVQPLRQKLDRLVAGNPYAKCALEMALLDLVGKSLGVPIAALLGGLCRDRIPCQWALATGQLEADIAEAEEKIAAGLHTQFKVKMGRGDPEADTERVAATARALAGRAKVRVDLNEAWDEATSRRFLPRLADAGVDLVEQPIPRWNLDGMARLAEALPIPLMADESLWTLPDALEIVRRRAAGVLSLKVQKSGGLLTPKKMAVLAEAAGVPCFGGSSLESSVGNAACAQLWATIPNLPFGCENFGPAWLADDLVIEPVRIRDGALEVPTAPGLGITLDEDKVAHYTRR